MARLVARVARAGTPLQAPEDGAVNCEQKAGIVILILEVRGSQAASLGADRRRQFGPEGGTIGRASSSDWVLPHTKVSSRHARITFAHGAFSIEDTSTNGVFVNSSRERLVRGRPHQLSSGDRLFIDPYDIHVSISATAHSDERDARSRQVDEALFGGADPFTSSDPFDDPFAPARPAPGAGVRPELGVSERSAADQELDPLKLIPGGAASPGRRSPTARDLEGASPMVAHYQPPVVKAPAPPQPPVQNTTAIPEGYDPLADSGQVPYADLFQRSGTAVPERTTPPPVESRSPAPWSSPVVAPAPRPVATPAPLPPPTPVPTDRAEEPPEIPPAPVARTPAPRPSGPAVGHEAPSATPVRRPSPAADLDSEAPTAGDLRAVLEGAGLVDVEVTEDLARDFGRILHVVVSGVMDVLQARQQIKDEFRMRVTQFKRADNNPLKFSANVEDALHNLLVKRNAAYLPPVEAFEDAFDDVRCHQLAMLAGLRVAFDAMIAEFNPDRLQDQFDRQLKKGSLLNVPAKLRYWELYRDRSESLVKDPETAFRKLFGEAFARAYEEQLATLKEERRKSRPEGPRS
jgi:type VI secretion system FHA domain protein